MNRLILETNTLENALSNITFTKQSSVGFKIKIFPSNVKLQCPFKQVDSNK